jgi:hypothetical protein
MGNRMMVVSQAATAHYGSTHLGFYQQQQQQLAQHPVTVVTSSSHGLSLQRAAGSLPQQPQQQQQQQLMLLPVTLSTVAAERQDATAVAPPMSSHALTGNRWSHQAAQLQAMHTQQQQQQLQMPVQHIVAAVYGGSAAHNDCFGSSMFPVSSVAAAVAAAARDAMSDCSSWSAASVAEITCGMLPVPAPVKTAAAAATSAEAAAAAAAAGVACDAHHLHHTLQRQLLLSDTTRQGSSPAAESWSQAADVACLFSPATTAAATKYNAANSARQLSLFAQSNCNSSGASSSIGLTSRLAPTGPTLCNSSAFPCINSSASDALISSMQASSRVATTEALSVALQGWQQQQPAWYPRATQPW